MGEGKRRWMGKAVGTRWRSWTGMRSCAVRWRGWGRAEIDGEGRRWRWKGGGGWRAVDGGRRQTARRMWRDGGGRGGVEVDGEGKRWKWKGCRRRRGRGRQAWLFPVTARLVPLSIARSSVAVHAFCPTARERDKEREREIKRERGEGGRGEEEVQDHADARSASISVADRPIRLHRWPPSSSPHLSHPSLLTVWRGPPFAGGKVLDATASSILLSTVTR